MKNKFIPVILITAALGSSVFALRLAAQPSPNQHLANEEYSQLQIIDQRLATKVVEFLELSDLLAQQLKQARLAQNRDSQAPLLVGNKAEPTPIKTATMATNKAPTKRVKAPWWSGYKLNMVVVSNGVRSAVINNRYLRTGDMLSRDIRVQRVEQGRVVLQRGGQQATLSMK